MIGYEGKAAKRFVTHPLPEGAMYNGTIIDRAYMIGSLRTIDNDNPGFLKGEVKLIVDGSSILSRRISTPKLKPKQLVDLVKDEFADTIRSDEIICGYRQLKASENAVMGYAATKEQMDSYVSVFAEAGIKLSAIRVGAEAVLNFVESRQDLQQSIIVINLIDGMTMLSMIFVEGSSVFVSRTRLYGDDKEQALAGISDNLSGLVQFAQSQKFGQITASYYIGLSAGDVEHIREHNQNSNINMQNLQVYDGPGGTPPPETHFCCLNIQMTGKCVDFLVEHKKTDAIAKKKGFSPAKLLYFFPAVVAAVLGMMAFNLFSQVSSLDSEIARVEGLIDSPATRERQLEIGYMRDESALLYEVIEQAEVLNEWKDSLIPATSQLLDSIIFLHGMEVRVNSFAYNEASATVRVGATCRDSTVSTHYVDYLLESSLALRVTYVGYGSSGEGFGFSVDILLNADFDMEQLLDYLDYLEYLAQFEEDYDDEEDINDPNGSDEEEEEGE